MQPPKVKRTSSKGPNARPPSQAHGAAESAAMQVAGPLSSSDLVPIDLILEPEHPIRTTMDDVKMEELIASMKDIGLLQPIILVRHQSHFEVVIGHRRLYAARSLGWARVPALIFANKGVAIEAARIHENEMRESVNAGDEAVYLKELVERYSLDEAGLCALIRRKPNWVAARWSLLLGDPEILQAVRDAKISLGVAQELNRITDEKYRRMYLAHAARAGYSASAVAQWRIDWEAQGSPNINNVPQTQQAQTQQEQQEQQNPTHCFLCGGYMDPWNLEVVYVHKHERAEIMRQMQALAQEPEPPAAPAAQS